MEVIDNHDIRDFELLYGVRSVEIEMYSASEDGEATIVLSANGLYRLIRDVKRSNINTNTENLLKDLSPEQLTIMYNELTEALFNLNYDNIIGF